MSSFLAQNKKYPASAGWIWFEVHVGQTYYLFNKNSMHTREILTAVEPEEDVAHESTLKTVVAARKVNLTTAERVRIEGLLADPGANIHLTTNKKGELRVHLTEVPTSGPWALSCVGSCRRKKCLSSVS